MSVAVAAAAGKRKRYLEETKVKAQDAQRARANRGKACSLFS